MKLIERIAIKFVIKRTMKRSKKGTLNLRDFIKGLVVSIGAALLTGLLQSVQSGAIPNQEQLSVIGMAAGAAGLSYLGKNLTENSNGDFGKEPKEEQPGQ